MKSTSLCPPSLARSVRRIIRTPALRFMLALNVKVGKHQLYRLVGLFAYFSHVAGCIYWYVAVLELESGLAQSPAKVNWPVMAQEYLPPTIYAGQPGQQTAPALVSACAPLQACKRAVPATAPEQVRGVPALAGYSPNFVNFTAGTSVPAAARSFFACYLYVIVWGMLNVSGVNLCKPENTTQTACSIIVVVCSIATVRWRISIPGSLGSSPMTVTCR